MGRRRHGTPLQYFCLENPMDGGAWQAAVHGVAKSLTQLSDFTFTFTLHFHALEKEMATHSSVLAWRIPGAAEPGGLRLWGRTESDMTELTQQQQQHQRWGKIIQMVSKRRAGVQAGPGRAPVLTNWKASQFTGAVLLVEYLGRFCVGSGA